MDRGRCHSHDTSHLIEWLVELKALLGGLDSTDALVGVGSNPVVAADSNPVAVAVGSNPVVVADSNPVAVVEAVAVVVQVESAAFGLGQQGGEGPLLYQLQVKT